LNKLVRHICVAIIFLSVGCSEAQTEDPTQKDPRPTEEQLIEENRAFLKNERERITQFIKKNDFEMQQTGSGMYYMLLEESAEKAQIKEGDRVEYEYRITLLDGTPVANSTEDGNRALAIGKEQAEIGLHEAFLLLSLGDRAMFIFPSHLAHGISLNDDDVPPRSTLIYELKPIRKIN
jgi:FKBP-type peptidyl-prolyl cis-trans isomerase